MYLLASDFCFEKDNKYFLSTFDNNVHKELNTIYN